MTSTRSRAWCLTLNNYTEEESQFVNTYGPTEYIIVGDEVGENGTRHLQIYFRLKNAKTFSKIKKQFPRAHIEVAKGSDEQNRLYCSKEKIMREEGNIGQQGRRNDLSILTEEIKKAPQMSSLIQHCSNLQSIRTAEKLLEYYEPKRNWKPKVSWYYGPTGTGKLRAAWEEMPEAYCAMETAKWWCGYDGHSQVIIDDYRQNFCSWKTLLQLLDRYQMKVEVKGGSRQFLAKEIIITAPTSPEDMFFGIGEDVGQLTRRITIIREYQKDGGYIEHKNPNIEQEKSQDSI